MSCVSTGWPVPVLCTPQMAPHTSFLSRQPDVIASFSFGACTLQTCFQPSPDFLSKSVDYDGISTLFTNTLVVEVLSTYQAWIYIMKSAANAP